MFCFPVELPVAVGGYSCQAFRVPAPDVSAVALAAHVDKVGIVEAIKEIGCSEAVSPGRDHGCGKQVMLCFGLENSRALECIVMDWGLRVSDTRFLQGS